MSRDKVSISLIDLHPLAAIGVKSLLQEEESVKVMTYQRFEDFIPFSEATDAYIVSAETFTVNLDFFLPRKQKTLIVGEGDKQGERFISGSSDESEIGHIISELIKSLRKNEENPGDLSVREKEVLKLIAAGKINKEIADELCISVNTVISHRKNISIKLGVKSASGLSLYAMMNGLI